MTIAEVLITEGLERDLELLDGKVPRPPEPIWKLGGFVLEGTQYEPFTRVPEIVSEKLRGRPRVGFVIDGLQTPEVIELTQHNQDDDDEASFVSITNPHRTIDGAVGTVDNFIRLKRFTGLTFFERHAFARRGTEEAHTAPRPFNDQIEKAVTVIMGHLYGPNAIEQIPTMRVA